MSSPTPPPAGAGPRWRAPVVLAYAALVGFASIPLTAAADFRAANDVILWTSDEQMADALEDLWETIGGSSVEVIPVAGGFWIRRARGRGQREADERSAAIAVTDLHEGVRRLFTREDQSVLELRLRPSEELGGGVVTVDVDAAEAYVVITGYRASDVPRSIEARPPTRWGRAAIDSSRLAVRYLGRRWQGEPLSFPVSPGARVSLLVRREPIRLRYPGWQSRTIYVDHVPGLGDPPRHRLDLTLDGQPLRWQLHGDATAAGDLPERLARGPHRITARLSRIGLEELVDETTGRIRGPAHYALQLSAGGDRDCVVLDGDAVARADRVRRLGAGALRVVAEGTREGPRYGEGTRICAWAPVTAPGIRRTDVLATTGRHDPAVLTIEVEPLSPVLRWGLPIGFFLTTLGLLLVCWWPRRRDVVTHLAWTRAPPSGYRDRQPASWGVVRLPTSATPLTALDPSLDDVPHTITPGPPDVLLGVDRPVVVVAPGFPAMVQLADFRASAGTMIVDGNLCLLLLGERGARRVHEGEVPIAPDAAVVERAREIGFTGELIIPRPSRAIVRAAAAFGVALSLTGAAYLPSLLAASPGPQLGPWAETTWAWAGMLVAGALTAAVLAWTTRVKNDRPI